MSIKESSELKLFREHYNSCIRDYEVKGRGKLSNLDTDEKGHIINSGECGDLVRFVIETLPKELNKLEIEIWEWETIHTFIVAYDKIWDAQHCYNGKKLTRDNLNMLFLCYVSSIAFGLNERYCIESRNGHSIQYDPWEFVDNQSFDHDRFPVLPSREVIYTVKEFLDTHRTKTATKSLEDFLRG